MPYSTRKKMYPIETKSELAASEKKHGRLDPAVFPVTASHQSFDVLLPNQ